MSALGQLPWQPCALSYMYMLYPADQFSHSYNSEVIGANSDHKAKCCIIYISHTVGMHMYVNTKY